MQLIPKNNYILKYSGEFCHVAMAKILSEKTHPFETPSTAKPIKVTFIGVVETSCGARNIFYQEFPSGTYIMFDTKNVENYLISENDLAKEKTKLEKRLKEIENLLSTE